MIFFSLDSSIYYVLAMIVPHQIVNLMWLLFFKGETIRVFCLVFTKPNLRKRHSSRKDPSHLSRLAPFLQKWIVKPNETHLLSVMMWPKATKRL